METERWEYWLGYAKGLLRRRGVQEQDLHDRAMDAVAFAMEPQRATKLSATVVVNKIYDNFRHECVRARVEIPDYEQDSQKDRGEQMRLTELHPAPAPMDEETVRNGVAKLDVLNAQDRDIVERYRAGQGHGDIARAHKLSIVQVEEVIKRAKRLVLEAML
jgi:DNA-directed RNA polymerase specialized sigma24 family protein